MSRRTLVSLVILVCAWGSSYAQKMYATDFPDGHTLWDGGLYAFTQTRFPSFESRIGDVTQYLPAVIVPVMKLSDVECKSGWKSLIVSTVLSYGIEGAVGNALKYSVGRPRPDSGAENSFPSGHTSTAFLSATILQKEYGWKYPWLGFGGYAVAASVGMSRILSNRHWGTDGLAGSVLGILYGELGYYLTGLIFKNRNRYTEGWLKSDFSGESRFAIDPESSPKWEIGMYAATAAAYSRKDIATNYSGSALTTSGIYAGYSFARNMAVSIKAGIAGEEHITENGRKEQDGQYSLTAGLCRYWTFLGRGLANAHAAFGFEGNNAVCSVGTDLGFRISNYYSIKFTADWQYSMQRYSALMLGGGASFCF